MCSANVVLAWNLVRDFGLSFSRALKSMQIFLACVSLLLFFHESRFYSDDGDIEVVAWLSNPYAPRKIF